MDTPQTAEDFISQMSGNELASIFGSKGLSSAAKGGIFAALKGAPLSAYPKGLSSLAMRGMFAPAAIASIVNRAGGISMAANQAEEQAGITKGMGYDPVTQGLTQIASFVGQPHTLTGKARGAISGDPGSSEFGAQIGQGQLGIGRGQADPFGQGHTVSSGPSAGTQTNPAVTSALEQYIEEQSPITVTGEDLEGSMGAGGFGAEVARGGGSAAIGIGLGHEDPAAAIGAGLAEGIGEGGNVSGMGPGPGPSPGHGDIGGDGGGDGGTVLCTVLYAKGIMPDDMYKADSDYGKSLPQDVIDGYHLWAIPVAGWMTKSELFTRVMTVPVMSWAKHMAGERTLFGTLCEKVGVPVCRLIGRIKYLSTTRGLKPRRRGLA
jgi:hypothetical protein